MVMVKVQLEPGRVVHYFPGCDDTIVSRIGLVPLAATIAAVAEDGDTTLVNLSVIDADGGPTPRKGVVFVHPGGMPPAVELSPEEKAKQGVDAVCPSYCRLMPFSEQAAIRQASTAAAAQGNEALKSAG